MSSFSFQFIAAHDIKAGKELYCPYINLGRTKAERQTDLASYGFSCNCSACINATPTTDELRKTYERQVANLGTLKNQPELMTDVVASAKVLEAKMVAEGLDVTFDFLNVLLVVYLIYTQQGRRVEIREYERRIQEYAKIHVHEKPMLQQLLNTL